MSWDPNAGYENYDQGYGNYDQGYGQQGQFQGQGQQQPQGQGQFQGQGQQQYDPYAQQQQQQYDQYGQQNQQQGYYNPNDYNGQNQGQTNAYRSTPTPQAPPPGPPPGQGHPQAQGQGQGQFGFNPQAVGDQFGVNPMMADMAMSYGSQFMGKGQEELKRNLDKYVSIGQLKYYFAVDTGYVTRKLGRLLFPFANSDWSIKYNQEEPVQPKFDLNAPDLYIPSMAYVTYILIVGYILGLRNAFSPDELATTASSALVWLVLEIGVIYLTITLMNINTNLCKWDVLSFSTYKYVAMTVLLLAGLLLPSSQAYYLGLLYISGSLAFFLVRTLKLRIGPEVHGMESHGKRKLYMILLYAGLQPLLIWWMTSYLVPLPSIEVPGSAGQVPLDG